MKTWNNYKIYVNGWNCDFATRLDEAFKKAGQWVKMGYTDVGVYEIATKAYMKHDIKRTDRF